MTNDDEKEELLHPGVDGVVEAEVAEKEQCKVLLLVATYCGWTRSRSRSGNNGRQSRQMALSSPQPQPAQQQNHQQRQQQQQVKLSHHHHHYYNRSTPTKKVISGPYTHLFCSERHTLASSRVLYPRGKDHFLLPHDIIVSMINNNSTNNSTNNEWPQMIN